MLNFIPSELFAAFVICVSGLFASCDALCFESFRSMSDPVTAGRRCCADKHVNMSAQGEKKKSCGFKNVRSLALQTFYEEGNRFDAEFDLQDANRNRSLTRLGDISSLFVA